MVSGKTTRRLTLGAVLVLVLTLAAPVTAAPPDNPFVGSWETFTSNPIGEEHIRVQIGGGGAIQIRTDLGGICYFEYGQTVPLSAAGWGAVINDDPFVWEGSGDAFCHLRDGQGRQFVAPFNVQYEWDPATDTLIRYNDPRSPVLVRTGSDYRPSD